MRISLRPNEKIYINGAVFSVDRKVSIELLNDVTFLLEAHVMQAADAKTPLRQVYFAIQLMLMDPAGADRLREAALRMLDAIASALDDLELHARVHSVRVLVEAGKSFDALRQLRSMFACEDAVLTSKHREATLVNERRPDHASH